MAPRPSKFKLDIMKKILLIIFVASVIFVVFLPDASVLAMNECRGEMSRRWGMSPYGDYREGSGGRWYGARRIVRTVEEAKRILDEYYSYKRVIISAVKEKQWYFEAEVRDKNNILIDKVIIDKRTGRIRSIY